MRLIYSFFAIEFLAFVFVALAPASYFEGQTLLAMVGWLANYFPPSAKANVEFFQAQFGNGDVARYVILYSFNAVRSSLIILISAKMALLNLDKPLPILNGFLIISIFIMVIFLDKYHLNSLFIGTRYFFLKEFIGLHLLSYAVFVSLVERTIQHVQSEPKET